MSRIGDLQDIRAMAQALQQAMSSDLQDPYPATSSPPIGKPDEVKNPWPGLPEQGVERVSASRARGAQAPRAGEPARWEQLSKAQQQRVQREAHAAAEGKGLIDPWGPRPPGTPGGRMPPSGL